METLEQVLAHHGIKGMKWGVRRRRPTGGDSTGPATGHVTVTAVPGKKVKTSGGSGVPIHPDAVRAIASRQVAKASGAHALNNDDFQAMVKRMNLEQQYRQLLEKQPKSSQQQALDWAVKTMTDAALEDFKQFSNGKQTRFIGQLLGDPGGKHRKVPKK